MDFLEITKTQNYAALDVSYFPKKKYTEEALAESEKAWLSLQDEVFMADDSPESRNMIRTTMGKMLLIERLKLMQDDANLLVWFNNQHEYFAMAGDLKGWEEGVQKVYRMIKNHDKRISIKFFEPVSVNLKIMDGVLASLMNEYNTKHKTVEKKVDKKEKSLNFEVLQVNIITGLNLKASEMTCSEWIEARKIAKEMNKPPRNRSENGVQRENT